VRDGSSRIISKQLVSSRYEFCEQIQGKSGVTGLVTGEETTTSGGGEDDEAADGLGW
jgi:hypothetical protein